MKYIRTKDNIYELQKTKNGEKYLVRVGELIPFWNIKEYKIINQADTIEELCDELIFDNIFHSRMTPSAMHTKENKQIIKSYLKQNIICYGAIWTDKGLIYVAKMKGILPSGEIEWELL